MNATRNRTHHGSFSYFEINLNSEKWFYTKYMGPISSQGTMLFVLATDFRFNEI